MKKTTGLGPHLFPDREDSTATSGQMLLVSPPGKPADAQPIIKEMTATEVLERRMPVMRDCTCPTVCEQQDGVRCYFDIQMQKASEDFVLYGRAVIKIDPSGRQHHIPHKDWSKQ